MWLTKSTADFAPKDSLFEENPRVPITRFLDKWMLGVISRDEATFSLDANRHVMNQQRRLAITNSLPVMENWTRVVQMAHFVANRCHAP
jgi:hypothetical protein